MPALRFTPPPQLRTSPVLVKTAEGLPYPQVRYLPLKLLPLFTAVRADMAWLDYIPKIL